MAESARDSEKSSSTTYLDADFDSFVESLLQKHHVPGLSITTVSDGQTYTKGYGFARLPDVRANADTLFCVGSTTKAMLAAGIGLAMDEAETAAMNEEQRILGKERWSTPISRILKDDFLLDDLYATESVTIEDALSHRTGFAGADHMYGKWMGSTPKAIVKALRYLGPRNKPLRTVWQYNNLMYSAVGDVLETVTQMSWGAALRRLMWNPLGMTSTYADIDEVPEDDMDRMARGYFWTGVPQSEAAVSRGHVLEPYPGFAGIGPAGSVVSSARDFAKWIKTLLTAASAAAAAPVDDESASNPGGSSNTPAKDSNLISKKLFTDLTTPRIMTPDTPSALPNSHLSPIAYSLGWFHFPYAAGVEHPIIGHAGGLTGFGTLLYLLPNDDFGCVVMANALSPGHRVAELICFELMARRLGLSSEEAKMSFQRAMTGLPPWGSGMDTIAESDGRVDGDIRHSGAAAADDNNKWADFVRRVSGRYSNTAYGIVEIEDEQDDEDIIYTSNVPATDRQSRDAKRAHARSLSVTFTGERTWPSKFVLRSRDCAILDSSSTPTFFDLEFFLLHGMATRPSEEGSGGTTQASEDLIALSTWQNISWCDYGAAFKLDPSKGESSWTLGLRLSNAYLDVAGKDSGDWETEMIWFHQV